MKVKTVTVSAAGNISHPNPGGNKLLGFSQLKSSVSVDVEVEEESVQDVFDKLQPEVDELVRQHLRAQYNAAMEKENE